MLTADESLDILGEGFWDRVKSESGRLAVENAERMGVKEEVIHGWKIHVLAALDGEWEDPTWDQVEMLQVTFAWFMQGYISGLLHQIE